jgi:hypothetical protein
MPFALALWVLLLHAIAGVTALPARGAERAFTTARCESGHGAASAIEAGIPRVPAGTLRAARVTGTTAVTRTTYRPPVAGARVLTPGDSSAGLRLAGHARRVLATSGTTTHRLPSRGGLLPYYPTAPPQRV